MSYQWGDSSNDNGLSQGFAWLIEPTNTDADAIACIDRKSEGFEWQTYEPAQTGIEPTMDEAKRAAEAALGLPVCPQHARVEHSSYPPLPVSDDRAQAAIDEANKWVEIAEPIIREYSNLDETVSALKQQAHKARAPGYKDTPLSRIYDEAVRPVEKAYEELGGIIEGIRENALCDVNFYTDRDATAEQEDRDIADNDKVRATVVSVDAAINAVVEKMYKEGAHS